MCLYKEIWIWLCYNCWICWWFEHYWCSRRTSKGNWLLKERIWMKDLENKVLPRFIIEHLADGIRTHQSTYTEKVVKRPYIDKGHLLSTPIVVWLLLNDSFRHQENKEELLGPEVRYLSAIGTYLANNTLPYNILCKSVSKDGFTHIFQYLQGTILYAFLVQMDVDYN